MKCWESRLSWMSNNARPRFPPPTPSFLPTVGWERLLVLLRGVQTALRAVPHRWVRRPSRWRLSEFRVAIAIVARGGRRNCFMNYWTTLLQLAKAMVWLLNHSRTRLRIDEQMASR